MASRDAERVFEKVGTRHRQRRRGSTSATLRTLSELEPDVREQRRLEARRVGRHPAPSSEGRSRNMQAIRRADTKPEVALRSALHRLGYRFRKDLRVQVERGWVRPDIVFTRRKIAVFVDGCFWHSCPEHGRQPTVNEDYWSPKLGRTVTRDRRNTAALEADGWRVIRLWEHEGVDAAVEGVRRAIEERQWLPTSAE